MCVRIVALKIFIQHRLNEDGQDSCRYLQFYIKTEIARKYSVVLVAFEHMIYPGGPWTESISILFLLSQSQCSVHRSLWAKNPSARQSWGWCAALGSEKWHWTRRYVINIYVKLLDQTRDQFKPASCFQHWVICSGKPTPQAGYEYNLVIWFTHLHIS